MTKIVRLTESDIERIIERVIEEQEKPFRELSDKYKFIGNINPYRNQKYKSVTKLCNNKYANIKSGEFCYTYKLEEIKKITDNNAVKFFGGKSITLFDDKSKTPFKFKFSNDITTEPEFNSVNGRITNELLGFSNKIIFKNSLRIPDNGKKYPIFILWDIKTEDPIVGVGKDNSKFTNVIKYDFKNSGSIKIIKDYMLKFAPQNIDDKYFSIFKYIGETINPEETDF